MLRTLEDCGRSLSTWAGTSWTLLVALFAQVHMSKMRLWSNLTTEYLADDFRQVYSKVGATPESRLKLTAVCVYILSRMLEYRPEYTIIVWI